MMDAYIPYRRMTKTKKLLLSKTKVQVHRYSLDESQCKQIWRGTSVFYAPWGLSNMLMLFNYNIFQFLGIILILKNKPGFVVDVNYFQYLINYSL